MDQQREKELRRARLKLVGISIFVGFLIGLGVGVAITYHSIERVVVVPLQPGIDV